MPGQSTAADECRSMTASPMLHRVVAAGHLRYWILFAWAVALATEVRWDWVSGWLAVTIILGLMRGAVDARASGLPARWRKGVLRSVATLSCVAWAAAPLMAWAYGAYHGELLAVGLIAAGYSLVFTQMRSAPREAIIVSSPYSLVMMIMIWDSANTPGFWTLAALAPVLAMALLIKVVITQIRDREIRIFQARQDTLIHDLEEARDRADAASTAKSNFLGVISHELRTPMNGVLGAAQLLEASDLKTDQRAFVDMIQQSGQSLVLLLNDILDITKIEAGKMEAEITEVSMAELHQRVIGPFRDHARSKGLTFASSLPEDAPHQIRTDPLRLGQIVQNFLSNAIKFTSEGTVRLTITTVRESDERVRLTFAVEDEGMGISEADLARLFQPFTQVDASSTRRFSGTGLGLSIAKRMAELLGGEVQATSSPGVGSIFSVSIVADVVQWDSPVQTSPPPAPGVAIQEPAHAFRILVADDHPVNRRILETLLGPLGHQVTGVDNGQEAVDQAMMTSFDLVIMDVNMPVMDGLAAIREIRRQNGPNRETPIVVLSASARGEDHQLGLDAGADAYLAKPIKFSPLVATLELAAQGRSLLTSVARRSG